MGIASQTPQWGWIESSFRYSKPITPSRIHPQPLAIRFARFLFFFHFSHVRPPSTAFVPHKSNSIFYSPYVQITAPSWPRIRIVLLSVREFGWAAASPALSLTSAKPNSHPAIGPESSSINRSVRKGLFRITFRQIDFWKYFLFKGVTMKVMIFLKIGSYQKRYESKLKEFQYRRSK